MNFRIINMRDSVTENAPRDLIRWTSTILREPCLVAMCSLFDQGTSGKAQEDIFQRAAAYE